MSFDIILLRLPRVVESLSDITREDKEQALGAVPEIRAAFDAEFPGGKWHSRGALFISGERYALEVWIPDDPEPTSLHLTLRFGDEWEAEGDKDFHFRLRALCKAKQWQAFAVSDSSRIQ